MKGRRNADFFFGGGNDKIGAVRAVRAVGAIEAVGDVRVVGDVRAIEAVGAIRNAYGVSALRGFWVSMLRCF